MKPLTRLEEEYKLFNKLIYVTDVKEVKKHIMQYLFAELSVSKPLLRKIHTFKLLNPLIPTTQPWANR